jgi:PAS domain-containing protein
VPEFAAFLNPIVIIFAAAPTILCIYAFFRTDNAQVRKKLSMLLLGISFAALWGIMAILFPLNEKFQLPQSIQTLGLVFDMICVRYVMLKYEFLPAYEQRFKLLFQISPFGIVLVDKAGRIREGNNQAANMLRVMNRFSDQPAIEGFFPPDRKQD